jgi:hypothetical protein
MEDENRVMSDTAKKLGALNKETINPPPLACVNN